MEKKHKDVIIIKGIFKHHEQLSKFIYPIILGLFSLILFLMIFPQVLPKELHLTVNQVAQDTIIANKTVEDRAKTKEMRTAEANSVENVFSYDTTILSKQLTKVKLLFDAVDASRELATSAASESAKKSNKTASAVTSSSFYSKLTDNYPNKGDNTYLYEYPRYFYNEIFTLTKTEEKAVSDFVKNQLNQRLNKSVLPSKISAEIKSAKRASDFENFSATQRTVAKQIIDQTLIANNIYNEKLTAQRKLEAKNAVVSTMILQGQVIVQEGHIVDSNMIRQLKLLGMYNTNPVPYALMGLIVVLLTQLICAIYLLDHSFEIIQKLKLILLYAGLMMISVLVMLALNNLSQYVLTYFALLLPVGFVPLMMRLFGNRELGITAAVFQSLFALFVFYDTAGTSFLINGVFYLIAGILATMLPKTRLTEQLKQAALWLILIDQLLIIGVILYQGQSFTEIETWRIIAFSLGGQILTYLLSIGIYPYLEMFIEDDSILILNRLSNPNETLLRQMLEVAPGTYHHSMMVANLSANAVAKINGKSMLTRVACYYHDVGKMKLPLYFVENLPAGAKNPHDDLPPTESADIIFAHVSDGVEMLKKLKMPQAIIDICQQHHGTTLMRYFFVKAKEEDPSIEESRFRYPGPKPQTKEAAVVNIADSCEAAVRAMKHPTTEVIVDFVHNLIQGRIADGQMDESGISLSELKIVEKSLVDGLASTFYSRIEYPKLNKDDTPSVAEDEG